MIWRRLNIFWQFVLLGILIFGAIGLILSSLVGPTLTRFVLDQEKLSSVVFANRLAAEMLEPDDFIQAAGPENQERFRRFVDHLQVSGLFRVNFWNPQGVIVYSDDKALIGQWQPPSAAFKKALRLETAVEIRSFDPINEWIEIFAPITFGASPAVVGVVEINARSGFLKKQIGEVRDLFIRRIALSLVLMFATLSFIVWRASRVLESQSVKLHKYATGLEEMVKERTAALRESVQKQLKQAAELSRLKDEFVSLASHQLRSPPTTVNWYIETLLSEDIGPINSAQRQYLEEIYRANRRMVDLVNGFLNVSRLEAGRLVLRAEPVDLKKLAAAELAELLPQIRKKQLRLEEHYDSELPAALADPELTRVIFQNLLTNAVLYTPAGGKISLTIEKTGKGGPGLLIKVTDTGCGIPQNQKAMIFTKLFRADNVKDKEYKGTGLGLYLVKSIVEQSGGKIWLESEENKGTTFYVIMPLSNG